MIFTKQKSEDLYLRDSHLENIFINEYLPAAPGDYVKVFVYASMYAEARLPMDNHTMAEQLGIDEKAVSDAWAYWEALGAVRRSYSPEAGIEPAVEFVNLKELMYGSGTSHTEEAPEEEHLGDETKKQLFDDIEKMLRRPLNSTEVGEILDWVDEERISPDLIRKAFSYSLGMNKDSVKYISAVLHNWVRDGLNHPDQVEEYLAERDLRHTEYKRVMSELGLMRNATAEEKRMMDSWLDDMGYTMDRIIQACAKTAGISNPNFKYVNSVLENWKAEAERTGNDINEKNPVTMSTLKKYYDFLRKKEEQEAAERRREVYHSIPRVQQIDEEERALSANLTKQLLSGGGAAANDLKQQIEMLAEERAFLLAEHEYNIDYTEVKYCCDKCRDTGVMDSGEQCDCMEVRLREAAEWQKTQE